MSTRRLFAGGEFLITAVEPADVFVPEGLTAEHRLILKAARDLVKREIWPNDERIEAKDEAFMRRLLRLCGELGLLGTDVPEAYEGEELDKISTCLVTEVLGGAGSFAVTFSAHTGIGTLPIVYFGTEAQKRAYLPRLATGECFGAYCLTEPNAGSDALAAQTTAVLSPDGRHYLLNGEKIYTTNGGWADVFVLYAKVDGEQFTGFIVERDCEGLTTGPEERKMGINGSSTTSVVLKDCPVPVENVLWEVGLGHKIAFNVLNIGRYKLGASVVGSAKVVLAEAVRYAAGRSQFGRTIDRFGLVRSKLADMAVSIYLAESMAYRLAAMLEDRFAAAPAEARTDPAANARVLEEYAVECSIAKVFGSEVLDRCVDEAVQIFGGNGFSAEYPVERMYRDARINRIFEGTNEINRLLVAGTVFKRALKGRLDVMAAIERLPQRIAAAAEPLPGGFLARERRLVACAKDLVLLAAGQAAGTLLERLNEEQEVLGLLADMIIAVFAMESGLLRAVAQGERAGAAAADLHAAAARIAVDEYLVRVADQARRVVCHTAVDGAAAKPLADVDALMAGYRLQDTIALRRQVAERVIRAGRYPW